MTLHHAAALALVGWYLMVPGENANNPLSKWSIYRSYATAAECQIAIDAHRDVIKQHEEDHTRFNKLTPDETSERSQEIGEI